MLNISGTVRYRDTDSMEYSTVSFRVTLTDLQRLSKVFDDAKHRAASLRQLSFLLLSGALYGQNIITVRDMVSFRLQG